VVLYGCETWSLIFREKHGVRVFENRVFRIFGLKGDKLTGVWRRLHNEGLHYLYSSPNIIKTIKSSAMGRTYSTNGEKKNVYRIFVGKPERKSH
jgi:NAD(P)H-nitrite reductase large subunit